jgi:HlyD family secretion protein
VCSPVSIEHWWKMKKILPIAAILLIVGLGIWYFASGRRTNAESQYVLAKVQRADIRSVISSTGTLEAVETVDVGTQVSGTIAHIYVDFNDEVRKGQLLARLDTALLSVTVRDAAASVAAARAQCEEAERELERNRPLFEKGLLPEMDYNASLANLAVARATLLSKEAGLDRAKINLDYAEIHSPINGIVIQRNVNEGQTVAASLSTPTLFIIAKDLSSMRILAQADESDIGQIREGQSVSFTVLAYPDKTFEGRAQQIRLQPETVSNVVSYTVVVSAENTEELLLPGMTATLDFIIQQAEDVLTVPNSAIRLQPTQEMLAEIRKGHPANSRELADSLRHKSRRAAAERGVQTMEGRGTQVAADGSRDLTRLWYMDKEGKLCVTSVRTGVTDGLVTEILPGPEIREGLQVVSGLNQKSDESSTQQSPSLPRRF